MYFMGFPVNSYPSQVVPCQLVPKPTHTQYQLIPKLTVLSYCYVMYHTNKNTAHVCHLITTALPVSSVNQSWCYTHPQMPICSQTRLLCYRLHHLQTTRCTVLLPQRRLTRLGDRAFSIAGSRVWNNLPASTPTNCFRRCFQKDN